MSTWTIWAYTKLMFIHNWASLNEPYIDNAPVCGIILGMYVCIIEEVINDQTPCIIGCYGDTTKTTEAMSVTANRQVSVYKISGTACLTSSSECRKDRSNSVQKFTNDRTVGMYFQTVTHDWLAQGSVNACDTRVERLLCTLCSRSSLKQLQLFGLLATVSPFVDHHYLILGRYTHVWTLIQVVIHAPYLFSTESSMASCHPPHACTLPYISELLSKLIYDLQNIWL